MLAGGARKLSNELSILRQRPRGGSQTFLSAARTRPRVASGESYMMLAKAQMEEFAFDVQLTFGPAGTQAVREFVLEPGFNGFEAPVGPGAVGTASWSFSGVTDPSAFTVAVTSSWDHEPAFWSTTVQ